MTGFAISQLSEAEIAAHFHSGQDALRSGDFSRAVNEFKQVLALDPGLVEAEVNLGLAYHSLAEYDQAARHLAIALRSRPNLVPANVIAGADYVKLGLPRRAIPLLEHALKLDPSNREAREELASAYVSEEKFGGASEEFREIAELDPDKADAWFRLGHEYLDLSARLAYRGARLYRESAWGHRFLGDLQFQRGRWDDAVREFQKALSTDPRQQGLHSSLGEAYLHAGNLQEADKEFRRELDLHPKSELAWLGLAELSLKQGQATDALRSIGEVWNTSPEWLEVQTDFPNLDISVDSANRMIQQIDTSGPAGGAPHFLLAALYGSASQRRDAERERNAFEQDVLDWQKKTRGVRGVSVAETCNQGLYTECVEALRKQKPITDAIRLRLGKMLVTLRKYQEAADVLGEISSNARENEESSYWLALSYRSLGAECYTRLEQQFPDSWRTYQLRGEGDAFRQDLDDAIKEFQNALQLQPGSAELHEALGEAYLDLHSDEDAQRELQKSLQLDPSRTRTLYLLGRLYVQHQQNEKAVPYLQRAVRLQPDMAEANSLLGTAYERLGQFANAIPQLKRAAASDHYGNVHYQLFLAYRKLGQADLAQKALARSQELRRSSLERDEAQIMGSKQPDDSQQ